MKTITSIIISLRNLMIITGVFAVGFASGNMTNTTISTNVSFGSKAAAIEYDDKITELAMSLPEHPHPQSKPRLK